MTLDAEVKKLSATQAQEVIALVQKFGSDRSLEVIGKFIHILQNNSPNEAMKLMREVK